MEFYYGVILKWSSIMVPFVSSFKATWNYKVRVVVP